jgi:uncharacterized delta-60 repeat protein
MKSLSTIAAILLLLFAPLGHAFAASGDPDPVFGNQGTVLTNVAGIGELPGHMVLQPDGKILVAGNSFNGLTLDLIVARYNTNGTLDTSFGTSGIARINFGDILSAATDIALQPDGKIVVAGLASAGFGADVNFAVARFNANGTPDNSFDGDGKLTTSFEGNLLEAAFGLVIQPDGKIVAGGSRQNSSTGESWFAVARYLPNGALDPSFDGDGRLVIKAGTGNEATNLAHDLAVQPDGKMVLAGEVGGADTDFALVRLNTDGTFDNSFDGDGRVRTTFFGDNEAAYTVELRGDGKIVAAGFADVDSNGPGNFDFALAQYDAAGNLDPAFSADGKTTLSFGPAFDTEQAYDLAFEPNGNLVVTGQAGVAGDPLTSSEFATARLTATGTLDTSFGNQGYVRTTFAAPISIAYGLALQPDGKVLVGGRASDADIDTQDAQIALVRYQGGGTSRTTPFDFDGDGRADISVFRPSNGTWYIDNSSTGQLKSVNFGIGEDLITPADFDGDGRTDIAVFRPSTGTWYRLNSSDNSFSAIVFGQSGDLPVPADFDGDGKADLGVYRPSAGAWYRLNSSNGQFVEVTFGAAGDKPAVGDFDGDHRADISLYRPASGTWYRLNSANGQFMAVQFGLAEDKPVPADYDGDSRADIGIFRPSSGRWFSLRSSDGAFTATSFGLSSDLPAPADFDGDGEVDIAVFRPSAGFWYVLGTSTGLTAHSFGATGDRPIPQAFIP